MTVRHMIIGNFCYIGFIIIKVWAIINYSCRLSEQGQSEVNEIAYASSGSKKVRNPSSRYAWIISLKQFATYEELVYSVQELDEAYYFEMLVILPLNACFQYVEEVSAAFKYFVKLNTVKRWYVSNLL